MNLHIRSVSADDGLMENTDVSNDFLDMNIPSYPGTLPAQLLSQMITTTCANDKNATAGVVLDGVAFCGEDMGKIMANPKLSEIALKDPRRAKRILSNRKSAARSKERKMRYVAELELKALTLQNEVNMMVAKINQHEVPYTHTHIYIYIYIYIYNMIKREEKEEEHGLRMMFCHHMQSSSTQ
ncbi:hypothetical protein F511_28056 [Dorcoceras hygrometricum]|uniref:BZIP domain-containing protein n=1 Tax=Dorcoceras hygrometricum TaxID=472368 RepID=A0A2Z7B6P8_9LAMI|nr:hypothetical protein F511_28056 [Dorcoceras hygrometricum]